MAQPDDKLALELLEEHRQLLREIFRREPIMRACEGEQQKSFDLNNDPYKNGINAVKVENIFAKLKQRDGYDVTRLANTMISVAIHASRSSASEVRRESHVAFFRHKARDRHCPVRPIARGKRIG